MFVYVRNLLHAGNFFEVVPSGAQITLQYNASGGLENVYRGLGEDRQQSSVGITIADLIKNRTVPAKIGVTKGTSWVTGVLYASKHDFTPGALPCAVYESVIDRYLKSPSSFNFFAANASSTAVLFQGAIAMRQFLALSGFNVLPGMLVPSGFTNEAFQAWLDSDLVPFNSSVITNYVIFNGTDVSYPAVRLHQYIVDSVVPYVDYNGYIRARVCTTQSVTVYSYEYSVIVQHNIQPGALVICNRREEVVKVVHPSEFSRPAVSSKYVCSVCGKHFTICDEGASTCVDPHCPSLLVTPIIHFLSAANLPVPDAAEAYEWIRDRSISELSDLFLFPQYVDAEITFTYASLLRALIPISDIPNREVFTVFSTACANRFSTFDYYVHNPNIIQRDLDINHPDLPKLVAWLQDSQNVQTLMKMITNPQIKISGQDQMFAGTPIFRNKKIYITGTFIRGSYTDVTAILKSYAAEVVFSFDGTVSGVLVGGIPENVNGKAIRNARELHIPIMDEESFFKEYSIDADLAMVHNLE